MFKAFHTNLQGEFQSGEVTNSPVLEISRNLHGTFPNWILHFICKNPNQCLVNMEYSLSSIILSLLEGHFTPLKQNSILGRHSARERGLVSLLFPSFSPQPTLGWSGHGHWLTPSSAQLCWSGEAQLLSFLPSVPVSHFCHMWCNSLLSAVMQLLSDSSETPPHYCSEWERWWSGDGLTKNAS